MSNLRSNIDNIKRVKSILDGSERIPMRDNVGDLKTTFASVVSFISAQFPVIPIAGVIDYGSDFPNAPDLPDVYHLCDGTLIDDEDSVLDGFRAYNMNGADVVLTLTWTADAGGAFATVDAADLPAVNIGDWVTGAGIAAGSLITDITGAVVTISDVAANGSISSTFTNDGLYAGGGDGGSAVDKTQKITGEFINAGSTQQVTAFVGSGALYTKAQAAGQRPPYNGGTGGGQIAFDSSLSPNARTSTTTLGRTQPHTKFMQKAMRIK